MSYLITPLLSIRLITVSMVIPIGLARFICELDVVLWLRKWKKFKEQYLNNQTKFRHKLWPHGKNYQGEYTVKILT